MNIESEIREMKKILRDLNNRLDNIINQCTYTEQQERDIKPFFVKGHRLPQIVISGNNTDIFAGRYLILRVLYNENKPLTIKEICEITNRSMRLESIFINKLIKSGFVKKVNDTYKITEKGKRFYLNLCACG